MGRKACALSKSLRHELIIQILENFSKDEGLSTREIVEFVGRTSPVCFRTITRDLEQLSLHFPISDNLIAGKRYWKFMNQRDDKLELTRLRALLIAELLKFFSKTKHSEKPQF